MYNHLQTAARQKLHAWIAALNGRRTSDSHAASSPDQSEHESDVSERIMNLAYDDE
jgi:hypothetical protein